MFKTILLSLFLVGSHHFETVTPTPSPTINQAPQLKGYEIGTQTATEDEVFEFYVPVEDIFYDDGELTYSASEATKETLPTWLSFNDESYSFFGLPSDTDIGRHNISLTATDQGGLEASTYFLIEIMSQSENKDTLSSGSITGIILGLLAAISPCIVDGIAYARWRVKKKTEEETDDEEEDRPSSLLTCENYRNECCKGKFKLLNCCNKCDGCCSTIFSCLCDDCCKACCKEDSCNCCVRNQTSYHHPSGDDEDRENHTDSDSQKNKNEQNLTVGGGITASSGGAVNIDNSNKSNNSTQNTHVKNDHSSQVTNHYHHNVQVVKEEKNTRSNQRLEDEKLKIEIENLSNQLKDKDTKLSEKNEQFNELKFSLKEKDLNHQHELREKDQKIQKYTNELSDKDKHIETLNNQLNTKSQELKEKDKQIITLQAQEKQIINEFNNQIETLSDELKDKDTKLNDKSQQINEKNEQLKKKDHQLEEKDEKINMLSKEVNKKDNQLNAKSQELKEKDKQIITLQAQEKQIINEFNDQIETLSDELKDKDTKLNDKSQQINEKNEQLKKKDHQLEEKDEKINMLGKEINKKDNQINDKNSTISTLNNQVKANEQKIAELQSILQNIPKQPLDDKAKKELFKAIKNNNIDKVKMFLAAYKDVLNAIDKDNYNRTPFLFAAEEGRLAIAKLLKERGANVKEEDKSGKNALHLACFWSGSVGMVTWLLDVCKIDIESKNSDGITPFLFAVLRGDLAIVKLLKDRGANVKEEDKSGKNALHNACHSSGSEAMVTWLLDVCKLDIESKEDGQATPFLCAAGLGRLAIAKLLKQRGANIHAKDDDGNNALHFTCLCSGGVEMVIWLLDVCNINIESKGQGEKTPFLCAAANGQLEIAKLLRQRGANIHAKNKDGKNALDLAKDSWNKSDEMISYLKSLGLR